MSALLEVDSVTFGYKSLSVLDNVNLKVDRGESVALLGPSGCGKSTLLFVIAGLLQAPKGQIRVIGNSGPPRVGLVFQEDTLFPWLTVRGNIEFALIEDDQPSPLPEISQGWVEAVGLSSFADSFPDELSGGMRQRAVLARMLAWQPDVLLLDEPFASLDAVSREQMHLLLERLCKERNTTVMFVTHDIEEAVLFADRALVMSRRPGRIVSELRVPLERPRIAAGVARSEVPELRNQLAQLARAMFDVDPGSALARLR